MHTKCQKRAFWRVIRSAQQCAELSQYTTGMEKCKQKVEKKTISLKIYQIENLEEVWYTWRRFGRKAKEGFKMLQKICPICDHVMKYPHYCRNCRSWVKGREVQSAAYYLNESHPKGEKQCSYHGIGESSRERDFTEREKQKQQGGFRRIPLCRRF